MIQYGLVIKSLTHRQVKEKVQYKNCFLTEMRENFLKKKKGGGDKDRWSRLQGQVSLLSAVRRETHREDKVKYLS